MIKINISDKIRTALAEMQLAYLSANVIVTSKNNELWQLINQTTDKIYQEGDKSSISKNRIIISSRKAYKAIGKDPARYRLSAEALLRRTINGKGLYQVNNVVDLLNLVSIQTAFSIGGYDMDKIEGAVTLGCGEKNEAYQGIGRGDLNIENLPVFRDAIGAFGSPTSDSVRTMTTTATRRFLMLFFNFGNHSQITDALDYTKDLLQKYAGATNFQTTTIR